MIAPDLSSNKQSQVSTLPFPACVRRQYRYDAVSRCRSGNHLRVRLASPNVTASRYCTHRLIAHNEMYQMNPECILQSRMHVVMPALCLHLSGPLLAHRRPIAVRANRINKPSSLQPNTHPYAVKFKAVASCKRYHGVLASPPPRLRNQPRYRHSSFSGTSWPRGMPVTDCP
jgi:hypothetical protein